MLTNVTLMLWDTSYNFYVTSDYIQDIPYHVPCSKFVSTIKSTDSKTGQHKTRLILFPSEVTGLTNINNKQ